MRLEDERESSNVEDRRGRGGGSRGGLGGGLGGMLGGMLGRRGGMGGGMGGGLPGGLGGMLGRGGGMGRGGLGIGGLLLLLVLAYCSGEFGSLTGDEPGRPTTSRLDAPSATNPSVAASGRPAADAEGRFVSQVLASTEDVWTEIFRSNGQQYRPPVLVLFEDVVQSGCGTAESSTGPFYCPADSRLYLDLSFFRQMTERLGARGDFAWAYVIAHEVGHHVQNQLGILPRVEAARRQAVERDSNALAVRLELQADCFAGVWGNRARRLLEAGDAEEGINAAAAVGDDRLQRQSRGRVVPDSFTHGSSAQRVGWFRRGLEAGDPRRCDSFNAERL